MVSRNIFRTIGKIYAAACILGSLSMICLCLGQMHLLVSKVHRNLGVRIDEAQRALFSIILLSLALSLLISGILLAVGIEKRNVIFLKAYKNYAVALTIVLLIVFGTAYFTYTHDGLKLLIEVSTTLAFMTSTLWILDGVTLCVKNDKRSYCYELALIEQMDVKMPDFEPK